MIKYPAKFSKEERLFFLKFIDIPNACTQGETMEELLENARDALSMSLSYYLEKEKDAPAPSEAKSDDIVFIEPYPEVALPVMIKEDRKGMGKTQGDVAKKMNIPYQTYQRWERANRFNPTLKTLRRVADALGKRLVIDLVDKK